MSELLNFCLKLETMQLRCHACAEERKHSEGPPIHEMAGLHYGVDCSDGFLTKPDLFFVQTILPNWLEERDHRDPRVQMLREMRVVQWKMAPDRYGEPGQVYWRVLPPAVGPYRATQSDAARELCRRAFELMTMECRHCQGEGLGCVECSHYGWVPAWTERCKSCGGTGCDDAGNPGCHSCKGQKWVKVPEKARA